MDQHMNNDNTKQTLRPISISLGDLDEVVAPPTVTAENATLVIGIIAIIVYT